MTTAGLWVKVAGGRLAVQYLERAGKWAADVDKDVVDELEQIRLRLLIRLNKLEELTAAETGPDNKGEPDG